MAPENVRKFYEKLNEDEELQKKIKEALDAYTGDRTDEKAVYEAVIIPVAKEAGCEFTYEEAAQAAKEAGEGEISDDEVAEVAGGVDESIYDEGMNVYYDDDNHVVVMNCLTRVPGYPCFRL